MLTSVRQFLRLVAVAVAASALAACGGGGGGDSNGGGSAGAFTLNKVSVSFAAKHNSPVHSYKESVNLHLTDIFSGGASKVVAGYKNGVAQPAWLTVGVSGSGSDYTFSLTANTTNLANGTYSTTLTVGTSDANDKPLKTQDVSITLTLRDGLVTDDFLRSESVISGSSAQTTYSYAFTVTSPAGIQWTASGSQPWVQGPSGTQQGSGNFTVAVNTAGLSVGTHPATLTLKNIADSTDTAAIDIIIDVTSASLTVTGGSVVLGGASGLESASIPVTFKLNTDTVAHPWTLTATTTSGGNWLHASATGGTVSGNEATVNLDAIGAQLPGGTYSGTIELQVTVNGDVLKKTVPVTLNFESNRLLVSAVGVAFSSFPGRQVLRRPLRVFNTRDGASGVPWTAVSDQSWLTVTASGTTGDPLVLTANPAALSAGQYFAKVSVASPDGSIANQETVRVGLTVGNTNPTAVIDIPAEHSADIVTSPVEPVAFALSPASIKVYDTNSGTLLRTLSGSFTHAVSLTISDDGNTLYVLEPVTEGANITALDATTGAVSGHYSYDNTFTSQEPPLQYVRPSAHPILLAAHHGFDLATGAVYVAATSQAAAVSADQRTIYEVNGGTSVATVYAYRMRYTNLDGKGLLMPELARNTGESLTVTRGEGQDVALSPDEAGLYVAARQPYRFDVLDSSTLVTQRVIDIQPYPTSIETCWNKLIAGGAYNDSLAAGDIWVFDAAGNELARLDSGTGSLHRGALLFSGDGRRLVSGSDAGLRIQDAPLPP